MASPETDKVATTPTAPAAPAAPAAPTSPAAPANNNNASANSKQAGAAEKRVVLMPDKEELVSSGPAQRNWRGILIALLVIVAVLGLIMLSIVLLSPPDEGPRVLGERLSIRDLVDDAFRAAAFNGTWVSESELVYRDGDNGLSVLDARTLTSRVLMTNSTFRQLNAVDFKVSRDLKFVLLISEKRRVFDYSYEAKYTVYEVATQTRYPLRGGEAGDLLQLAEWGPEASQLVVVHNNDIYYKANGSAQSRAVRVTSSGKRGVVYNGIPDWLYEVEILRSPRAIWLSPGSKYLLYASFNDSAVGELKYPWYGALHEGSKYPKIRTLRYPKAGTPNPDVTLRLLALDSAFGGGQAAVELRPPPCISRSEYYFTAVTWLSNDSFSVVWMNRRQNLSCISVCRWSSWNCDDVYEDRSEAWVDAARPPVFSADGAQLVARLPVNDGDRGSFRQVVQVADGQPTALTHGAIHVTDVLAWDQENHLVYFLAAPAHAPDQRHLYRVPDAGREAGAALALLAESPDDGAGAGAPGAAGAPGWQCLTCPPYSSCAAEQLASAGLGLDASDLPLRRAPPAFRATGSRAASAATSITTTTTTTPNPRTPPANASISNETVWDWQWGNPNSAVCLFSHAYFPPGPVVRYYVLECLGPDVPEAILVDASSNLPLLNLQQNTLLRDLVKKRVKPQIETFQVAIDHEHDAQVRLFLPPGLRDFEEVAFPLVLHVDGSPGSQLVSQRWSVDYSSYLASSRNYIVAEVDGRGSGFRGDRFLHEPYLRLGSVELEDQIAVVKYLSENLKIVDRARVGLWGQGYGGFATTMILSQDVGVFACGIAVAPVASWAHYDSAFSERYLRTPNVTDNYRGYEEADVTARAGNLRGKRLLLAHGTADLRAHYGQSMLLARALAREGALFQHQTYPDEGHEFLGVRDHLYRSMDAFWDDCFGPLDLEDWEDGVGLFSFKE